MKEANVYPLSALDGELSRRFHDAAEVPFDADWVGVVRRAAAEFAPTPSRPRRTLLRALATAAVLAAVVGTASPALGLDRIFLDFLRADRAPEKVQVDFGTFDALDPVRGPGVATAETRTVHTFHVESGDYDLSVSPANDGFCWGFSGFGMTCETSRSRPIDPFYRDIPQAGQVAEPALITGAVRSVDLGRITITFENGDTVDLPLVIVSEPIGASFFFYDVPEDRWKLGSRPARVAAYDSAGVELGTAPLMYTSAR